MKITIYYMEKNLFPVKKEDLSLVLGYKKIYYQW